MTVINHSDVPQGMHNGQLVLAQKHEDNDDDMRVLNNCAKMDTDCKNVGDLERLLSTMRVRITKNFTDEAIAFMLKSQDQEMNVLLQRYEQEHPTLLSLLAALRSCKLGTECKESCHHGRLDFLIYFERQGRIVSLDTLVAAAKGGHLNCLIHMHKRLEHNKDNDWRKVDVREAAAAGHLHCLQYLIEAGLTVKITLCAGAALRDKLTVLKYLISQRRAMFTHATLRTMWLAALIGESLNCMEYLLETFTTQLPIAEVVNEACRANKGSVLKLLLLHDCVSLQSVVNAAICTGSIECLVYLHYECNANCLVHSTMMAAAEAGKLYLVFELMEHDCSFDHDVLTKWVATELMVLQFVPQPKRGAVLEQIRKYLGLRQQMQVLTLALSLELDDM